MVFCYVTTFHFESVKAATLKDFGYSKNARFKEVQVVLGLLIDCEGRPIGYDLFPGNTFEGHTLEKTLEKIRQRFGIRNVIIVADRGINSSYCSQTSRITSDQIPRQIEINFRVRNPGIFPGFFLTENNRGKIILKGKA